MYFVKVACGFAYSTCTTLSGEVYAWGAGENGRLGLGGTADKLYPVRVDAMLGHTVTGTLYFDHMLQKPIFYVVYLLYCQGSMLDLFIRAC